MDVIDTARDKQAVNTTESPTVTKTASQTPPENNYWLQLARHTHSF